METEMHVPKPLLSNHIFTAAEFASLLLGINQFLVADPSKR
jgi:hypothetical protein